MKRPVLEPRFWVVLLVASCLLIVGGASFVRRIEAVEPVVGVDWTQASTGPIALSVRGGSPAEEAGLREGDLLLEIGGAPAPSVLDAGELAWSAEVGGRIEIKVRRGVTEHVLSIEPHWAFRAEPYIYLAIVGLAFWLSGLFIAIRWPGIRGGTIYSWMAACMFLQLTLSRSGRADLMDWAIDWGDVMAGALAPALMFHVGVALTKRTLRWRRAALTLAYGSTAVMVLWAVWLSPSTLRGVYRTSDPLRAVETWDRAGYLLMGLLMLATAALLAKSYSRSSSVMHRSQMRWLMWGLTVGFGPFVMLYAVPWALGAQELPEWARFLAVLPIMLVPAAFTAALARYRLYDLDLLLLRGFSEVAAVFCTAAVLSATVFLLRHGPGEFIPLSTSATRYIGFLAAALSYPQLRQWVRAIVDRAFYRQRYSYRATLLDWARELNAETDLSSLLGHLRGRVRETLGVPEAQVLVRTGPWRFETVGAAMPGGPLELDAASLGQLEQSAYVAFDENAIPSLPWARYLFSMKVKGRLRAVLAIAERERQDESLTTEDRTLLGTLAAHAATAIEAARLVLEVRQRADEIERLHALQARILESGVVGLLLLDGKWRILAWNRALEDIYGLSRDEVIGRELSEIFPLQVVRRLESEGAGATDSGGSRIFRLQMVNRRDERLTVNIAVSPVDDGEAGDGSLVVSFDDVTQRVKLEEQVLQQERLASLGLLAAGVAHEINTPLTGISSYTQLLLENAPEDSRREMLEKIEAQTRRASGITRSLLNLARPEQTEFESLDLNEALSEVLQLFEPQVRGGDVSLESSLDPDLPEIRGNKGKLQQVALNLLLNARDAVGDRGTIFVTTYSRDDRVCFEVRDDGVGIPEEDQPRIFDPFFSTKGRGMGTGLGLSISYGIVREHQGRIETESIPGEQTRFRVELPAKDRERAMA